MGRLRQSFTKHAELPAVEGRHTLYTYRDLDRQSAALARTIADAGVNAGDIVPLLMRRSPALIVAQVAVVRLGAAYAPIDLASPLARQQLMLETIKPSVVVTDGGVTLPGSPDFALLNVNAAREPSSDDASGPWCARDPDALAYVMFTSGTTGVPKGVMVPQSGIVRLVCDADFAEFHVGARWGFLSSPAFDASTLEVWAPLLNGGCCVVQEEPAPSLDDLAAFLLSNRITDTWLTAALCNALVEDRPDAFANLRQLLTGGEPVSPRHARAVLEAFPYLRLINGYGPTENTTFTLCHTITLADTDDTSDIPIGRPIRGTVVRIGTDKNEPDEGELLAGGEGVALGYLGDRELTEARFIEIAGQRWYRTGDVVRRREDGTFEFLGRVDRQVKLQGHRIELEGVERWLGVCPGVGQAAVLVRGDTAESRHLVACYSGLGGPPPAIDVVADFLVKRLPPAAVPRSLYPMAHLPLNHSGKLDYAALDILVSEDARETAAADTEWQSDTERLLAGIWQECLPSARVHRHTSFQAIGGTSLLALRISSHVRRQLGRDLTPIDVLRSPILAEQARRIDAAAPFDIDASSEAAPDKQLPLTRIQRALLAGTQLDTSGCAYLVHIALHLAGMPDRSALRRAFDALATRHPSLRMSVRADGDPTYGRVCDQLAEGWWQEHDAIAQAPSDLSWPQDLLQVINRPMDLAHDGVMRVDWWPVADGSSLLVWTVHHVSIDEASIDRCLMELDLLLTGTALQPVYGSPLGFATLEKAWTDHEAEREWSNVFVAALAGHPPLLPPAPGPGREVAVPVPAELSRRLQAACSDWGITPFSPLLVAYGLALQDVFGAACRFVSTPFSRRLEPELIEPAGCLLDLRFVEAGSRLGESEAATLARVSDAVLKSQRPSFLPHRTIAEMVAGRDPQVAQHLNAFGFTWRLEPARHVQFGPQRARLLRVPQQGARFGLSLHAWLDQGELHGSVEAIEAAFVDGRALSLGEAFVRRLDALCDVPRLSEAPSTADDDRCSSPQLVDPELAGRLRTAWSRWVGTPATAIVASTDFLSCGGNSLTVMRMTAQLRREHGLSVDAGAFLARPTFRNLCALAGEPVKQNPSCCVVVGPVDAAQVILLIPGYTGQALGLYTLADEIQRRIGDDHAVIIADLEAMLLRAPQHQTLAFLRERLEQLVKEVGPGRVAGIVGSSMGGSLGLLLAQRFPGKAAPPVWLLDTYEPLGTIRTLFRRAVRPFARALLRSKRVANAIGTYVRGAGTARPRPAATTMESLWLSVRNELGHESTQALGADVHLIQARQTVRDVGLLWRRSSSGFNPKHYARWRVHQLEARHGDLPRSLASDTAELVSSGLRHRVESESESESDK